MKLHLTKVSLALLAAAFLLGCQDQGSEPVGPEGVGPQFAEGGGPQSIHREGSCKGHHRHDPGCDEILGRPEYTVVVTGDLVGSGPTTPVRGGEIIVNEFDADLTFFVNQVLSCGGSALTTSKEGTFVILAG